MLFISCRDGTVVFDFAKKSLDGIAQFVKTCAEGRFANALWHEPDVGKDTAFCHLAMQSVGVISAVPKQDIARSQTIEHVGCAAPVMCLSRSDLQNNGKSIGIDKGMYLGGQTAL